MNTYIVEYATIEQIERLELPSRSSFFDVSELIAFLLSYAKINTVYLVSALDEHLVTPNITTACAFIKAVYDTYPHKGEQYISFQEHDSIREALIVLDMIKEGMPYYDSE